MQDYCEVPLDNADDDEIRQILSDYRTIAVVGLSNKPERASYGVSSYVQKQGYRIIPVNPRVEDVLGEQAYASLLDVPETIEIVNVFRRPEAVPEIVDQAIAVGAKVIWMQEGIAHNEAADRARDAGIQVVMNKCLLKEHARHFSS